MYGAVQFVHPSRPFVDYSFIATRWKIAVHRLEANESYGRAIVDEWLERRGDDGMVVLEQDMAVGEESWQEMAVAVALDRHVVYAVPYRLYNASTHLIHPVWAHRAPGRDSRGRFVAGNSPKPRSIARFALGCTYLPAVLLNPAAERGFAAAYPRTDDALNDLAIELALKVVTLSHAAVHLHY